mgnify:CR=1 FL=1
MKAIKATGSIDENGQLSLDRSLVGDRNCHVEVIILIPDDMDNPETEDSLADFRQSWHEAMTGQTIPISELWKGIE